MRSGKPKPGKNRSGSNTVHAKKRAKQRYGLELAWGELRTISRRIERGQEFLLERQSLRISTYLIKWESAFYPVAYDHKMRRIVSFLPPEYLMDLGFATKPLSQTKEP